MNRIIYKKTDGSAGILIPAQDVLGVVGIAAIAEKDVPQDLPYWIVSDIDVPADRSQRDAWLVDEVSLGSPDGFGGVSHEFTDAQLTDLYNAGVLT